MFFASAAAARRLLLRPPTVSTACRPITGAVRSLSSSSNAARSAPRRLLVTAPCPTALTPRSCNLAALGRATAQARARFLSSTPQMPEAASATITIVQQVASWVRQNPTVVAVVVGMSLVMYGFYRGSVRLMKFFFNVTDKQVFTLGFIGGMLAAAGIAGAMFWASRRLTFHVDDIYQAALRELRKYEKVNDKLGGLWRPGGFRGYAVESLQEAIQGSDRRARTSYFEAPARRVQMIFMIRGLDRDAMVSVEAYKRSGDYHFEMLSLDLKAKPSAGLKAEHVFLLGDDDHVIFQELSEFLEAAHGHEGLKNKTMDEAMSEG